MKVSFQQLKVFVFPFIPLPDSLFYGQDIHAITNVGLVRCKLYQIRYIFGKIVGQRPAVFEKNRWRQFRLFDMQIKSAPFVARLIGNTFYTQAGFAYYFLKNFTSM